MWYGRLADFAALLHGAVVVYVLGGLLLIGVALWRRWPVARHFWFRFTHLALCLVIVVFELAGQPCPLTTLEQWFRDLQAQGAAYQGSFVAHYVHEAIHFQVAPEVLAWPTLLLVLAVVALFVWAGPRRGST